MPKRPAKKKERWIIIFDGPGKNMDTDENVIRIMDDGEGDCVAAVFSSAEEARAILDGHFARDYAVWILNIDTGDTQNP